MDDPLLSGHRAPVRPPRNPGEPLWEFRRADHHTFAAELRFHGESYGWEAMILRDGDLLGSRRFIMRAEAETWAASERQAIEKGWDD
jgi:hypothetical protein